MKLYSYDTKRKKKVFAGELKGECFHKHVTASHLMRSIDGYGISQDVIDQIVLEGGKYVFIHTPEGILESNLSDWQADYIKEIDFGHGKQRFLPCRMMKKYEYVD